MSEHTAPSVTAAPERAAGAATPSRRSRHLRTMVSAVALCVGASAAPLSAVGAGTTSSAPVAAASAASGAGSTGHFVSRMSARWAPFTDSTGTRWDARSWSLGTDKSTLLLQNADIGGTEQDELYQVAAYGVKEYRLAVPRPGSYRVRLLMAEGYWSKPGKRVFDVFAEGELAAEDIDIYRSVGKAEAHDVTFEVPVQDGRLDLRFVAKVDHALISAIEVSEVGQGSETPGVQTFAYRMSAAPYDLRDSAGRAWLRRGAAFGSSRVNTRLVGEPIAGTKDEVLYQHAAYGMKGMLVPVPATASYHVRLLLTEAYWSEPGKRVIDVRAEGRDVASAVDAVAAAGPKAAHDVTFDVRVDDGMLNIDFVNLVDQPMVSGIEVTSNDPAAAAGLPSASLLPLGKFSVFHQDIRKAPVAENSAPIMARLQEKIHADQGHNAAVNAYQYNSAFYTASASTRRYRVGFTDCQNKGYLPDGLYDGPAYFLDVPIPDGAMPATGTDAQMGIYDPERDQLWEFWVMKRTAQGGWEACWGGRVDDVSSSDGRFPEPFGVSASGLVMAGGVVSVQEAARGQIDHALYLTVTEAQALVFSYPANRTDGRSQGEDLLVEGQRLRLDPKLDVTTLGLTPFGVAVAKAAQKYGFIVSDLGGTVSIATESGRPQERRTGSNPWDVLLGGPSYEALAGFPWDQVEVMPVDYGKP
ncbi:malectin domain-containing carbohydrate-binding protein [Gephyromycinifex aptenodytis]|uniref:malectin domain-containing carbohydrate-binding protein n=1 Tax=Gephyromycinifex aptenodytis TaxID=2716227 RepID=UPI001445608B|nr:malectin domain-containing carbohydrate-binding protein [Gephyromycinifex aptenodytis]